MGGQYTDAHNIDNEGENKVQRKRVNLMTNDYPDAHTLTHYKDSERTTNTCASLDGCQLKRWSYKKTNQS